MKMSIANELFTTSGNATRTAIPIAQPKQTPRLHRAPPAAKAGRLEGKRQKQHGEYHDQSGVRADVLNAQRFRDAHHQAGDQRADHIAERAQHHGDEGHQHEHLPDKRVGGIERHQQRTRSPRQRQRDAKGDAKYAVGIDAHQCRDVTVLRRRTHRLAEIGGMQEHPERAAQRHRDDKGDEFCHGM